ALTVFYTLSLHDALPILALGTILLPSLAKTHASKDPQAYSRLLDWGLRLCLLLVLPCALALALLAEPLTVSLFQYGKFSATDARSEEHTSELQSRENLVC